MKIEGIEDKAFQARVQEAADMLMSVAIPRQLPTRIGDVSCRMAASIGVIVENSKDRLFGQGKPPPDLEAMAEFLRSYGGAMGFAAEALPAPEDAATLIIHYMLDFLSRRDPALRSRVVAKLALINLEEHTRRPQ